MSTTTTAGTAKPTCEICGKTFASQQTHARHIQRFHPVAKKDEEFVIDTDDKAAVSRRLAQLEKNLSDAKTELAMLRHMRAILIARNTKDN